MPGLGQIPILGALFKSKRYQRTETELAIFVTPVVMDAEHPTNKERVRLGRTLIEQQLHPTELNIPFQQPDQTLHPNLPYWNPWEGEGSQWQQEATYAVTP